MRQESQHEPVEQETLPAITLPVETATPADREMAQMDGTAQKIAVLGKVVRKRRRNLSWIGVPLAGLAATLSMLMAFLVQLPGNPLLTGVLFTSFIINYAGLLWMLVADSNGHKTALAALVNTDDLRAVGALAESLHCGEHSNTLAGSALMRLLPQITAEHANLLTPSQRRDLRKGLKFARFSPALAIAIINALMQIGEAEDLFAVERLAKRRARTREQQRVRQAAEACVAHLKARFAGDTAQERPLSQEIPVQAPAAITPLSSDSIETLAARLGQINRLRKRNLKVTAAGAISSIALGAISLLNGFSGQPTSPLLTIGLLSSAGLIGLFAVRGLYAQRNLTQALLQTEDLRLVGPLVEAASGSDVNATIAAMALTRLLPRLQASDVGLLGANGHENLNKALNTHRRNTEFVLAALKALQQVGDGRSLPVVQNLAERAAPHEAEQSVREAAQACLPFLQMRAAQDEASRMLLRASERTITPPNTLLRPVQASPESGAEELLRPGTPHPEPDPTRYLSPQKPTQRNDTDTAEICSEIPAFC